MNHHFDDITSRIAEKPSWYDDNGTPRYGAFTPNATPNIYANEAVLLEVACQGCKALFKVSMAWTNYGAYDGDMRQLIKDKNLHYGDPPNTGCCASGPTMNSEPIRVLEYWHKSSDTGYEWKRDEALEVGIEPDWVGGGKA